MSADRDINDSGDGSTHHSNHSHDWREAGLVAVGRLEQGPPDYLTDADLDADSADKRIKRVADGLSSIATEIRNKKKIINETLRTVNEYRGYLKEAEKEFDRVVGQIELLEVQIDNRTDQIIGVDSPSKNAWELAAKNELDSVRLAELKRSIPALWKEREGHKIALEFHETRFQDHASELYETIRERNRLEAGQ